MPRPRLLAAALLLASCGPKPGPGELASGSSVTTDDPAPSSATRGDPTTGDAATRGDAATTIDNPTTSGDSTTTTGASSSGATTDAASSGGSTRGGAETTGPSLDHLCDGKLFECIDGDDNDGDGLADMADPECTSPCDNDEGSLQTDVFFGQRPCNRDCYFDTNGGWGDDECRYDLGCDPLDPGAEVGCFPKPCEPMAPPECLAACLPLTPNGCDCFGCCHVDTPDGPIDIYLGSSDDCSLANVAGCQPCTFAAACNNPCEPDACELCFGESAPPAGCDAPGCPNGRPCLVDAQGASNCPPGEFCLTGCCAVTPA